MEEVVLGRKIKSGGFRDCYEVAGSPRECAKVVRDARYKELAFGPFHMCIRTPMQFATFERFGRVDLNKFELEIIRKLPPALRPYSLQNARLARAGTRSVLVADRVMNYDGTYSKTLEEAGIISVPSFWEHMERLLQVMKETDTQVLSINPKNIVIQEISAGEWRPVFVDVKNVASRGNTLRRVFGAGRNREKRNRKLDMRYIRLSERHRTAEAPFAPHTIREDVGV